MSKNNASCKRTSIGGQAVIEGIMMNGPHKSVLAVRNNKNNEIVIEDVKKPAYREKCKLFKLPIIRGVVAYAESMVLGYKTLMRSADLSGMTEIDEDEESPSNKTDDFPPKPTYEEVHGTSPENDTDNTDDKENRAFCGVEVSANEKVDTDEKVDDEKKSNKISDGLMGFVMVFATIMGFALALFLFMYVPTLLFNLMDGAASKVLSAYNLRGLIEGVMKLIIFIGYILLVSLTKDIKRVFQYHGAEHKTIFCYEHGLPLTVENVRIQKRFHPRCGTSFLFLMIAVGILLSTLVAFLFPAVTKIAVVWVIVKILLVPLFCGVGYELLKICGKYDNLATKIIAAPGLWIQRITTKEPSAEMIEVAIKSIEAVIPENPDDDKIG